MSRPPLREHLDSTTDEARISRMWAHIRDRRDTPRRSFAPVALAAAVLLAVTVGGLALWTEPPVGELRTADGRLPSVIEASPVAQAELALDDGSRIQLEPGSRLETIENGGERFATLLRRGSARFSVQPGGPRRWVVESGLATVEVIGTVFHVDRRDDGVEVRVEHGIVLVRGERVPDRVRRLTAGQSVFVPAPESIAAQDPPASAPRVEPATTTASSSPLPEPALEAPTPSRPAPRPALDPVEAALARADAARRRGQPAQAVAHLHRAAAVDTDPRAALAAFTIGRIELDELNRRAAARAAFQRALALGLPDHLAQQARRRLEEIAQAEATP